MNQDTEISSFLDTVHENTQACCCLVYCLSRLYSPYVPVKSTKGSKILAVLSTVAGVVITVLAIVVEKGYL